MQNNINLEPHYTGKLRVRVCGLCRRGDKVLLLRHKPFAHNTAGFWSLPGGGLQYGESMAECLKREFKEETGLEITVSKFLFLHELVKLPLHALEVFFEVTVTGGSLTIGHDPELSPADQLIAEVAFKSLPQIRQISNHQLHGIFHHLTHLDDLFHQPSTFTI